MGTAIVKWFDTAKATALSTALTVMCLCITDRCCRMVSKTCAKVTGSNIISTKLKQA